MTKPHEPIALIDLDGTLADFDTAMKDALKQIASPDETNFYFEEQSDEPPHITARRRLIKSKPGFWRDLPKLKLGFDVLEELVSLKFRVSVLTKAPRKNSNAWKEKVEWCNANLPAEMPITIAGDKGLVYGKTLVDDWVPYIERWLEWRPRGLVVMPAHDRNKDYKHPNVVRYDGTNLTEVSERLRIIRETAGD